MKEPKDFSADARAGLCSGWVRQVPAAGYNDFVINAITEGCERLEISASLAEGGYIGNEQIVYTNDCMEVGEDMLVIDVVVLE